MVEVGVRGHRQVGIRLAHSRPTFCGERTAMNKTNIFFEKARGYISLLSVGTFLAIVTPIAYLSGLSFYEGGLYAFGVEADIFPLSIQYIYVKSYYALMFTLLYFQSIITNLLNGTNWFSLLILSLTIIAEWIVDWYSKKNSDSRLKRTEARMLSFLAKHYDHESMKPGLIFSAVFSFFSFLICLPLAVILCLWLPFYAAYSAGQREAEKIIKNYREHGCKVNQNTGSSRCTLVKDKDGKILYEGILVAINDKEIAMFDKDGSHIFAKQEGFVLQRKLY
jgi:hypothetical protein